MLRKARCSYDCRCHGFERKLREELLRLATCPLGEPVSFKLDDFTLKAADADQVALFFNQYGKLYHIRKLTLHDKSYEVKPEVKLDTPEQILPYIVAIRNLPLLEEISFAGSSLGIWAAYALAEALRSKTRLRRADFSNCFKGRGTAEIGPAMDALVSAFLELPSLAAIAFAHNAFGPDVEGPLIRLVRSHTPLQELDITDIGLGPESGVPFAKALRSLADKKKTSSSTGAAPLRKLLCSRNRLVQDDEDELFGMREWAAGLAAHPDLKTLEFGGNGIRRGGMDVLVSEGLARVRGLEELDLQDNIMTSRGGTHRALAEAVAGWPRLRVLNLNDSLLGSRGAALLIEALAGVEHDSELESLGLVGNNISEANTAALAAAFGRLPSLRKLELNTNNFPEDDPGFEALGRLLQERGRERNWQTSLDELTAADYSQPSQPTPPGSQSGSPNVGAQSPPLS
ncbi:hypothetical protein diail_4601 [Diaporthe ilicicola]|nr:hypothetical protein diail_4601 [Diaporthe ilicicola]